MINEHVNTLRVLPKKRGLDHRLILVVYEEGPLVLVKIIL